MSLLRSIIVAIAFVAAFEAAARSGGWLDPTEAPDPYLGFPGTSRLYRLEEGGQGRTVYRRSPNKEGIYRDTGFPAEKPASEYRVFCIGGSSVRSDAFLKPDGSFPHMLSIYLSGLLPERYARAINAGGGGTGSIQNLEVVREILDYEPDLVVIYPEGGEKNLVPPSPQGALARKDDESPARVFARRWLTKLRLYHGVRDVYRAAMPRARGPDGSTSAFSAMLLAVLGKPFGPDSFTRLFDMKTDRVPVLMEHVLPQEEIDHAHERFVRNLKAMAADCRERGVPIVFVQPVRNLKAITYLRFHIDPSEIREGRSGAWRADYEAGLQHKRAGRWEAALLTLRKVRAHYVDDRDELLAFFLGQCLEQLGRHDEALLEFEKPYLWHPMRGLIARAGAEAGVPVVDPYPYLLRVAGTNLPDYDLFTDAFHPMPTTNRLIARAIVDTLRRLPEAEDWNALDHDKVQAAGVAVTALVDSCPTPPHNRMIKALADGDYAEAVRVGRSIPEEFLYSSKVVESVYLGIALTRARDLAGAREVHRRLKAIYWKPGRDKGPPLDTDADVVRHAYGGDLFSWF